MRFRFGAELIGVTGLFLAALPALAHHSFAAEYDANKPVIVKGVIAKVDWMNPHAYLYIVTKDLNGKAVSYGFETGSPNALLRRGWKKCQGRSKTRPVGRQESRPAQG